LTIRFPIKEVRGRWRYACSKSAVFQIAHFICL